jgi:hypothetical protein
MPLDRGIDIHPVDLQHAKRHPRLVHPERLRQQPLQDIGLDPLHLHIKVLGFQPQH